MTETFEEMTETFFEEYADDIGLGWLIALKGLCGLCTH